MAAAWYSRKLSDSKYSNWIKAGLAVLFTKEGIEPFVYDEIDQFRKNSLADICNNNGLHAGTTCSNCSTENVVVCPTNRICNVGRGKCGFHRNSVTHYLPSGCPNKICHNLKTDIQRAHRYYGPSYKNTDATQWCSSSWEVAKCFMPPDGYKEVRSVAETDFNGINSVIINYKGFQAKVHTDLSKKGNIFDKGRDIGKAVRHSPTLEVEDTDLQQYFTDLHNLLSDPAYLAANTNAQKARKKLSQLQNDTLVIGKEDVRKVLDDVAKAVQDKIRTEMDEYRKEAEKQKLGLVETTNRSVSAIEGKEKVSISELNKVLLSAIDDIEKMTEKSVKAIEDETGKGLKTLAIEGHIVSERVKEGVLKIETVSEAGVKKIESETGQTILRIQEQLTAASKESEDDKYNKLKKDFKSDLLAFNQRYHSTIPLSPVLEEQDTPLQGFYVQPNMNSIEVQKTTYSGPAVEVRKPIKCLQDVFCRKSKDCENIYLTSGAGQGKTTFCKYLVLTWCQAHGNHSTESSLFTEEDIRVMRDFEYIFLVSLRDCGIQCDVDDMIASQIIQNLGHSYPPEFMQTLLNREKYLIILDGLDEWSHPVQSVSICSKKQDGLPHRKVRKYCTILTTTRSWKLSVVNMKASQIDNHIEIEDIDEDSSRQLIANAVRKILHQDENAETSNSDRVEFQIREIEGNIHSRSTPEFERNPLLLTYMICLLCDDKSLGKSKCELYVNILDFLLQRCEKRDKNNVSEESTNDSVLLPVVFRKCCHIRLYEKCLMSLGKLAFKALFCENEERSLVFESSLMDSCLTEEEQKLSLSAGLLIQNKLPGRLITRETTVSFSHKTFQEFFAALYIYSKADLNDVIEKVLKKCSSLENILEMSNVFIFLSGICPERLRALSTHLSNVLNDDTIITEYRSLNNLELDKPVKNLQNMYVACVKESQDAKHVPVYPLLQDAIIDRDRNKEGLFQMLQNLIITNIANIKSIRLIHCESERGTQELIRDLNLDNIHTLESLQLYCQIASEDLTRILAGSVNTLKQVIVKSLVLQSRTNYIIYSTLSGTSLKSIQNMQYLTALHLINLEMPHHLLDSLISHLNQRTCMRQIVLSKIRCIDHDEICPGFSMYLSQHAQLTIVGLGNLPLRHVEINTSTLKKCGVGPLQTPSAVSSFLNCLLDAKKLRTLYCYSMRHENDCNTMMAIIPQLVTVTDIVIADTDIKNKVLQLHPDNVNIKYISMQFTTLSSLSLKQLVPQVQRFQHSVVVCLQDCTVTQTEEYERMKYNIKSSDKFEVLCDGEEEDALGQKMNVFAFRT